MHVVLIGDSIFDNSPYVLEGEKCVSEHLAALYSSNEHIKMLALDGAVTDDVLWQAQAIPINIMKVVVSCGGNDALEMAHVLTANCTTVYEAMGMIYPHIQTFRLSHQKMIGRSGAFFAEFAVCTIYTAIPDLSAEEKLAISFFNDIITEEAMKNGIDILDLRQVCIEPTDYSKISPIEPSHTGGEKIALKVKAWLNEV